ncbi:xylose isomerase [Paenibacillus selenitireducens]|uniref:Xylose isomerase n=1 Tax=Paenibacillus selenitireducens TaxID=1324314 RepID=A0A1T2X5C6_9BACL|nr:TIM barrel protein [Paenibacillus selenitireducens]OPA74783.1 xylose isomerase [Paenibacillus selenitireducens]
MKLSGFADEISSNLAEQIAVLQSEGISYLEFRSVWDKNVLKMNDDELQMVLSELENHQIRVSAIGSPIGKISIVDDFEPHLLELDRAISVAKRIDTKYIRIFSFIIPEGEDPRKYREEVLHRMKAMVERAEKADVVLLLENEHGMYGDVPERCSDVLTACDSPSLRLTFDPGNFVQCGVKPVSEAYHVLKPYIEYVHIKDVLNGKEIPAGEGEGELLELIELLQTTGYNGFLSLEPHLAYCGRYPDRTPEELFVAASRACKKLLSETGAQWA